MLFFNDKIIAKTKKKLMNSILENVALLTKSFVA